MAFSAAAARSSARAGCCWADQDLNPTFPPLDGTLVCDTVVIGGGIVGLTAALSLCDAGRQTIVLESRRIGTQVTGRSTAKVTAQHGLIYRYLTDHAGPDTADLYARANTFAMDRIRTWIDAFYIGCDYEKKDAYCYIIDPRRKPDLQDEADAARQVGLTATMLDRAPLPFQTAGAVCFPDQGQFNPTLYLEGLAAAIVARGGKIREESPAISFAHDGGWRVSTPRGAVRADHVIMATNMPVKSPLGYSSRTQPRMHVAMAFRPAESVAIDGMFIGLEEPTHSIRVGRDAGGPLLLVLGPRFNTGQDADVMRRFLDLDSWAQSHLPVGEAVWRWCNEDYDTADRRPYVGQPDVNKAPGFYVATGFNGWGITNRTAAGLTMAAEISAGKRLWGDLYDPLRSVPKDFHQSGDTQSLIGDPSELAIGQGGVLKQGDEAIALYRKEDGKLAVLSAACTHKGCTVTWNNADGTWDCPCHGSIFDKDGRVIHGPARRPLSPRRL